MMFSLLLKQFLRTKIAPASLLLLFIAGIISISIGKGFLQQQQADISETTLHQKEHIERLLKYENKEFGLLMYYLKFAYINPTSNIAGLSIGQRDINSSIQTNNIRGLEGQKYDTDIRNPYQLMMGNFDLSFVILYLFPLVIISLCYNLYSEEKENGTWALLKTQSKSTVTYLLKKMAIPFFFIHLLFALLCTVAAIWLKISFTAPFSNFIISNSLYISSWFAIALLIISFYKSSAVNAVSLLTSWLLLTLLLPAAINNYIIQKYTIPESLSTMLKQRDGYHKKWDIPKDSTLQLFFREYPQYKSYQWKDDGFDWLWYYAMQHMGDADAKGDRDLFMHKLKQRETVSKQLSYWLPTLYAQQYNTQLAQTNLQNHLQFMDSSTAHHEKLRLHFYPKIFTAAPVLKEDWTRQVPSYCFIKTDASLLWSLYPFSFVMLTGAAGLWRLRSVK
jgi:ABC-2 type transport system permease protein